MSASHPQTQDAAARQLHPLDPHQAGGPRPAGADRAAGTRAPITANMRHGLRLVDRRRRRHPGRNRQPADRRRASWPPARLLDAVDGALARASGGTSPFGASSTRPSIAPPRRSCTAASLPTSCCPATTRRSRCCSPWSPCGLVPGQLLAGSRGGPRALRRGRPRVARRAPGADRGRHRPGGLRLRLGPHRRHSRSSPSWRWRPRCSESGMSTSSADGRARGSRDRHAQRRAIASVATARTARARATGIAPRTARSGWRSWASATAPRAWCRAATTTRTPRRPTSSPA